MWRHWYEHLAGYYRPTDCSFIDYGYVDLDASAPPLGLAAEDEPNRYCIQLYQHIIGNLDLKGLEVIEIGSGPGGGADYINRYLQPKSIFTVDFSRKAARFCHKNYSSATLHCLVSEAELLPLKENSVDVLINVEASHCFSSFEAFIGQVERIVRPGGYFLFADMRSKDEVKILYEQLHRSCLTIIKETDITSNVLASLDLDHDRKIRLINQLVSKPLRGLVQKFAAAKGSEIYQAFQRRELVYLSFALQKVE